MATTSHARIGILFLHALPLDGRMWSAQVDLLPDSTYAPTLYGHGDTMREWATAALSPVKEERMIVVGNSVGGSCALEVASIAPERVAALVLIGTNARHRPNPELHASALHILEQAGVEAAWATFWNPLFADSNAEARSEALQLALSHPSEDIARGVSVFHTRPDREALLSKLEIPVVFVTGADDTAPGPESSARQTGLTRNGRLHVIEDCGHYVPMERPEAFNAILRDVIGGV
ncbi:alpha/beta hydrolase [Rhizobium sp. TH2]|uniref:alpha/beta fold hydrolase n=1 Tax=Rhizobium sp. TH2 TaxID=2775403 RepID=UPI002157ADA4|nr:alpha/beta hydrolase [Rhizobium sp. TH2]UVC07554.1 alpha/beta hydrolase [Rhizobium sp. TH2]